MSESLEKVINNFLYLCEKIIKVATSLMKGLVPDLWLKNSYPSLKPLSGYVSDLIRRL